MLLRQVLADRRRGVVRVLMLMLPLLVVVVIIVIVVVVMLLIRRSIREKVPAADHTGTIVIALLHITRFGRLRHRAPVSLSLVMSCIFGLLSLV